MSLKRAWAAFNCHPSFSAQIGTSRGSGLTRLQPCHLEESPARPATGLAGRQNQTSRTKAKANNRITAPMVIAPTLRVAFQTASWD
jgi:hypothetical protein